MTMSAHEAIAARRTIRDFDDRPIEREILLRILDAGMLAPSHNHLREWHFVVVDDLRQRECLIGFFREEWPPEKLEAWVDECGMENECQRASYGDAVPKQSSMILSAGALIIPCFRQPSPLLAEKKSLHQLNAFASIWAVLENVLLAAASEGIFGLTKILSRPEEAVHVRGTLGIPDEYEIPCYLAIDYPSEGTVWPKQIPADARERISTDRWGDRLERQERHE
jgi:nitroreductase